MKKIIALTLGLCLCASSLIAAEEIPEQSQMPTATEWLDNMAYNFGRGVVNCLTFWVEVPRNISFEMQRNPVFGYFTGTIDGAFLGAARAFGGATDVLRLGLTGPNIYSDNFPEYVWQSGWVADDALVVQEINRKKK